MPSRFAACLVGLVSALIGCGDGNAPDPSTGAACSDDDLDRCEYPLQDLDVAEIELTITDPVTGRTLPLLARVPALPGPLPVYIWSHGGGFYPDGQFESVEWGTTIAKQGYAVIHIGHVPQTAETATTVCELASIPTAECLPDSDEDSYVAAVGKAFDQKGVVEKLPGLSDGSVAMGGPALDLSRVAIGGWSGGSLGPQLLLDAKIETTASAPTFSLPDARIVAIVTMSPSGPDYGGFFDTGTDDSWRTMRGHTFVGTGEIDVKPTKPGLNGPVRRQAYEKQPADGTHRLLYSNLPVGVGNHGTFNLTDLDSTDSRVSRFSRALRSAVVAFLDAKVKGDSAAEAWLETDDARILAGDADWERK